MGYGAIYNPSIANGIIYYISDTNMYALNETTGDQVFSYPLGYKGYDTTQVAINNGMLYFSGNGGACDLYALGFSIPPNLPTVAVTATDPYASESRKNRGTVQISRSGDTSRPLVVFYTASGSAENGIDYKKLSGKVTIHSGSSTATITLKPIDDKAKEKPEKIQVKLASYAAYRIGSPRRAVVTIKDND